jgi:hypothetical protein
MQIDKNKFEFISCININGIMKTGINFHEIIKFMQVFIYFLKCLRSLLFFVIRLISNILYHVFSATSRL